MHVVNLDVMFLHLYSDVIVNGLRDDYMKSRYSVDVDEWPPNQPKTIINVALIHYKGINMFIFSQLPKQVRKDPPDASFQHIHIISAQLMKPNATSIESKANISDFLQL